MNVLLDKSGFAGGYFAILVIVILGTFIIIELSPLFNGFIDSYNVLATQYQVTDRNHTYIESLGLNIKFLGIIMIIGVMLWGYVYAQENKT